MEQPVPVVLPAEKKELERLIRRFCLKSAQVIIQGRLGKSVSSKCNPTPSRGDKFNLAIKDYPDIVNSVRSALNDRCPNIHSSFVVEILLRTNHSPPLILEVWSLSVKQKFENARIHRTLFRKMSMMLKSLMCVSRATPAYKLSWNQGQGFVICYRIYMGKADVSGLGENYKSLCLGSIGTPTGELMQSVAFRTNENLVVSTKKFVSESLVGVSHDHFSSPRNFEFSSARPCNTLQSCLSGSSSEQMESPTYTIQQSPGTPSPNYPRGPGSRARAAMFTIGTPPVANSYGRTPLKSASNPGRKTSDISFDRDLRSESHDRGQKPFLHSTSDQHFSYPLNLEHSRRRISHVGSMQDQRGTGKQQLNSDAVKDASMHSTLTNEDDLFGPISLSPSNHSQSSSIDKVQSHPKSLTSSRNMRKSNLDPVTALKSSSPTNARVGFPDNIELNSKMPHHLAEQGRRTNRAKSPETYEVVKALPMPTIGAFVRNDGKTKKIYNLLHEGHPCLPFDNLLSQDERNEIGDDDERQTSKAESSSTSTSSSSSSGRSTPSKEKTDAVALVAEDFLMLELNPAFGMTDSAKDVSAFYQSIKNAPDLEMFKDNNGQETQETLFELTKQLDDYQKDAADFDEFIQELQAF